MKHFKVIVACLFLTGLPACSSDEPSNNGNDNPYKEISLSKGEADIAHSGNSFAWNLFEKLNADMPGQNICVSPVSTSILLTMMMNGAVGETRYEIANALSVDGRDMAKINEDSRFLTLKLMNCDRGADVRMANSMWIVDGTNVKDSFKATITDNFDALVENTNAHDFVTNVNNWCKKQTNGLIPKIMEDENQSGMSLINVFYFKNAWASNVKFKTIGNMDFNNADNTKSSTPFMYGKIRCGYLETNMSKQAHVCFGNGAYVMLIAMPQNEFCIGDCIKELNDRQTLEMVDYNTRLDLSMPKFKVDGKLSLLESLQALGIESAFSLGKARFDNISDDGFAISRVNHAYSFKVDEKGVVAAAVTDGDYITGALPPTVISEPMVVDRPFLFAVYERSTKCILFTGKIERF